MFSTFAISPSAPKQTRACDACRSLKIKCRNPRPASDCYPCDECRRAHVRCKYNDQPVRPGRRRKQDRNGSKTVFGKLLDFESSGSKPRKPRPSEVDVGEETPLSERRVEPTSRAPLTATVDIQGVPPFLKEPTPLSDFEVLPNHENPDVIQSRVLLDDSLPVAETQGSLDVWATVHEFFDTMYLIFPVISYVELASSLIMEPNWSTSPHLRTLLYALRLGIVAAQYRLNSQNESEVQGLVFEVEASRCSYNFADPPTLDAVVCSLILFAACNVLRIQNRAFLYLSEASFLLEAFVPTSDVEEQRRLRLQKVLFNTESASFPIYATREFKRRARRPSTKWESYPPQQNVLGNNVVSDKLAAHLLRRLTQIHLAEDAKQLKEISIESEASLKEMFGSEVFDQHRYARIQLVDIVITRQWRLSCQLVASRGNNPMTREPAGTDVESLGAVVMSWLCLLKEGDLRIVGLGKLVGLAFNICMLGGRARFQEHVRALVTLVMGEDREGEFALALADLALPMWSTIPLQVDSHVDLSACSIVQNAYTDFQTQFDWHKRLSESNALTHSNGLEWTDLGHVCDSDFSWASSIPWGWSIEELNNADLQTEDQQR